MRSHIEQVMNEHPDIAAWLKDRPFNTQRDYCEKLMSFSAAMKISPEEWRRLDKFQARDLLWTYVEPLKVKENSRARGTLAALKSWFRNLNGEQLPFDSGKGGKHYIKAIHKKASFEHIPSRQEVYQLIDQAIGLRDKVMLLVLFHSGIRSNALRRLTYGDVSGQLEKDIIALKITSDVDEKLRGAEIPFYYTFINGEAVETLRKYCEIAHKRSKAETPLFYTKGKKTMTQQWLWHIMRNCSQRAGFDAKTMWVHSLRKAFRKVVRQANIDDEDKEQLMGHVLQGSREAYFDRNEVSMIQTAYEQCNFLRDVPKSEVTKLRAQLEDEREARAREQGSMKAELEETREALASLMKQVQELTKQKDAS